MKTRRSVIGVLSLASAAIVASAGGLATADATTLHSAAAASVVASSQVIPDAKGSKLIVTAEAPNGDVAVAVPVSSFNADIDIAKKGHAPALFDTVPPGTVALAFSHSDLFVAGKSALSSLKRSTGDFVRTWDVKVAANARSNASMVYGDGRLWLIGSRGHGNKIFEINPTSSTIKTVASAKNVGSLAVGPLGLYYVPSSGHKVIRVSASGHKVSAPTHQRVNVTLSGPGAVRVVVVDGNELIAAHDAGQGFDSAILRYNAKTLAYDGEIGTNVAKTAIAPTHDGDGVVLAGPDDGGCTYKKTCIATIDTTTAVTTNQHRLPAGQMISPLLGPDPAVVIGHAGHARLVRLSAL